MVAAVDPAQEDRLLGFQNTLVSGAPLREGSEALVNAKKGVATIPVIASTNSYVAESLHVNVSRLSIPPGTNVPKVLASHRSFHFVTHLRGTTIGHFDYSPQKLYSIALRYITGSAGNVSDLWSVGPAHYKVLSPDHLQAEAIKQSMFAYIVNNGAVAADNQDTQFRYVTHHAQPQGAPEVKFNLLGRFDPAKLPGFSSLSALPLSYTPPVAAPGNAASRRALHGQDLRPTMNLGGYIAQPPFLLTNLSALKVLDNPKVFSGVDHKAPISVIRVRVAGATAPTKLAIARIKEVATLIRERTHLSVDVTAGSSPTRVTVDLPPGKFGRPALALSENWVKKGVAITILSALDKKSLVLFVLVLVVTALFLANGALASVRARRAEIGTLLCLGWGRAKVFRAILYELGAIGLAAGLVGAGLAAALVAALGLKMPIARTLFVIPTAAALAILAGLLPAVRASKGAPLDAVRPPVGGAAPARPTRGIVSMAFVNLRRLPGRTIVSAVGLLVGVAALAVLLAIDLAFSGVATGSLLGNVVSVQVRGVDYLSVGLAVALGAFSVADVAFLNLKERAPELVTLRTSGWRDAHLFRLVVLEGTGIGVLGGVCGAVLGVATTVLLGGPIVYVVLAGLAAAAAGVAVATLASVIPASLVARMSAPVVLAEE